MAYKYVTGSVRRGDIYNEDDTQGNTYIDWNEDALGVVAGGTTVMVVSGSTARVGIGTDSPDYTLDVAGNIGVNEFIVHNGDSDTFLQFLTNTIGITAGNASVMTIATSAITVNPEKAGMISFKVYDDQGESMLAIASNTGAGASGGAVGIHNESPAYDFVVGADLFIVSGSSVGVGSTWSGKEFHVTDGDSGTPGAPAACQVVVESGGNAGISLLSATNGRGRIYFGDASDIDEGIIEYKFSNNERFNITVRANEVMRIYESGYSNTITTLNGVKTTAGLFTEGHPYYSNDTNITVGDCCVLENGQIVRSSSPMQKNVGGIAWYSVLDDLQNSGSSGDEAWSLTLDDDTVSRVAADALGVQCNMAEQSDGEWVPTTKFQTLWKLASVGDSRQSNYGTTDLTGFKVCNEGGAVSAGDLLCTSTSPGYLMKQDDDIMHGYTVGKAMEEAAFDENGQAAGIYGYVYCG